MSSDSGNFIKGFLIGGSLGLLAGVLFAPKAGKEFRDDIINEGDDIIDKARSELDKIRSELVDLKDKITNSVDMRKSGKAQTKEEQEFEDSINSMDEEEPKKETKKKK